MASEFEKNLVRSINQEADSPEAVSRQLALRSLVELHTIKLILAWTLVIVPIPLGTLAILWYAVSTSTPAPTSTLGF